MPRIRRPQSGGSDYPASALLMTDEEAEGPSIWSQLVSGLGGLLEAPQHIVQSALTGEIPYTEGAPKSTGEFLQRWGYEPGGGTELTEVEGRLLKGAVWGIAGLAVGGPIGGGIFAALSQIGDPPKTTGGVVETGVDLASDPLMYFHAGKLSGGGRVPLPEVAALGKKGVGQIFTKEGTREFNILANAFKPRFMKTAATEFEAMELAGREAARTLIMGKAPKGATSGEAIKHAVDSGILQRGGMYFLLPGTDARLQIPGSEAFNKAVIEGFRGLIPESVKKAVGAYRPAVRDIRMKYHATQRAALAQTQKAMAALDQELVKIGLPPEALAEVHAVMSSQGKLGFEEAVRRYMPEFAHEAKGDIISAIGKYPDRLPDLEAATMSIADVPVSGAAPVPVYSGRLAADSPQLAYRRIDMTGIELPETFRTGRLYKIGTTAKGIGEPRDAFFFGLDAEDLARTPMVSSKFSKRASTIIEVDLSGLRYSYTGTIRKPKGNLIHADLTQGIGITDDIPASRIRRAWLVENDGRIGREVTEELRSIARKNGMALPNPAPVMATVVRGGKLDQIKKAIKAVSGAFDDARKAGLKAGLNIPRLNLDVLDSALTQKLLAETLLANGAADDVLKAASKQSKQVDKRLKGLLDERTVLARHVEDQIHGILQQPVSGAMSVLRRGGSAKKAADTFDYLAEASSIDLPSELATRQARLAQVDAEIAELRAHQAALKPGGEVSRAVNELRSGGAPAERLMAEIDALQLEKQATGDYFPVIPEADDIIKKLADDEGALREFLDKDIPDFFGQKKMRVEHGAGIVDEIDLSRMARTYVEEAVKRQKFGGFTQAHIIGGAPQQKQRSLKTTVKALLDPADPESAFKVTASGKPVERALRYDELQPMVEGLEHLFGKKYGASKIRRMIQGDVRMTRQVGKRIVIPAMAKDPVTALGRYYKNMGHAVGLEAAADDVVRRFGRKLSPKQVQEGVEIPGMRRMRDVPGMGDVVLPFDIAQDFSRWVTDVSNPTTIRRALSGYAALIQYWKQIALAWPAFHSRNAQSGILQMVVNGTLMNPQSLVDGTRVMFARGRMGLFGKDGEIAVKRLLEGRGRIQTAFGPVDLQAFDDGARAMGIDGATFFSFESAPMQVGGPMGLTRLDRMIFRANMYGGNFVEQWLRRVQMIDAMKQGYTPYEAFKQTARTHFLYESLSATERNFLRPYVFPFYAWSRFNIPYTLEHMMKRPGIYRQAQKWVEDMESGDAPEHEALRPDWIRKMWGVHVDREGDEDNYLLLGNFFPASDVREIFTDPLGKIVRDVNPVMQQVYTWRTGKVPDMEWEVERYPGEKMEFMGVPMEKTTAQLLRQIRWANEIHRAVGTLPPAVKKGDNDEIRRYLMHALVGHKVYKYDRNRLARPVIYKNRIEIRKMRGVYARSALVMDRPNMEVSARWLADRGLDIPTWDEIRAYETRSLRESDRMSRLVEATLE